MAEIRLHDTLTGEKKVFDPIEPGKVSMYNCGPTVYDYAHIGNLRSYVFADVLRRMFEYNGYEVNQVINITDIGHLSGDSDDGEDKMTKALKREGKPLTLTAMREVADFYFERFKEDLTTLNIELPEHFPFASDHIAEDIDLVNKLTEKGFTYTTSDGIYFDTAKFPDYGKLGNVKLGDPEHARIATNSEKKSSKDFAVWKFNSELGYDAPFGKGFPGWHIECSAMSVKYLGPKFDIHTGGIDHIPVHHNNEIAQSVCAGDPYAQTWMHNAFLTVNDDKMAKSEGNFITLKTLLDDGVHPLAYRYWLLGARYSSPLQFSEKALRSAQIKWTKLRLHINELANQKTSNTHDVNEEELKKTFLEYINNDLDTPQALALILKIVKSRDMAPKNKVELILNFDHVLGLELGGLIGKSFSRELKEGYGIISYNEIPDDIINLLEERNEAREKENFDKGDELRKEIESHGYKVDDTSKGTFIKKIEI